MSVLKFIQNLLKIKRFRITGFSFKNWGRELWLDLKPYKRRVEPNNQDSQKQGQWISDIGGLF